jgi:hypothetical protein
MSSARFCLAGWTCHRDPWRVRGRVFGTCSTRPSITTQDYVLGKAAVAEARARALQSSPEAEAGGGTKANRPCFVPSMTVDAPTRARRISKISSAGSRAWHADLTARITASDGKYYLSKEFRSAAAVPDKSLAGGGCLVARLEQSRPISPGWVYTVTTYGTLGHVSVCSHLA